MRRGHLPLRQVRVLLILALYSLAPIWAKEFTVNSPSDIRDAAPGDGWCSIGQAKICTLRAAVQETNALAGDDTIILPAGRFVLTIAGSGEEMAANGDLDIRDDLTIRGQGAESTTVDAAGIDRVFHLAPMDLDVTIEELTLTGGVAEGPNYLDGVGGAVLAQDAAFLRILHTRIIDNKARSGGGVSCEDVERAVISYSEFSDNWIEAGSGGNSLGAALHSWPDSADSQITVSHSTFSDNGCLSVDSFCSGPCSCLGGVSVAQLATPLPTDGLFLYNSTVSGNEGYGVYVAGTHVTLGHSTLYGNSGCGMVFNSSVTATNIASAVNTIFANNGIQDCCLEQGSWNFQGFRNLSSDDSCGLSPAPSDQPNTDPKLYRLGYYPPEMGTFAPTHHPRWGSPVVDAGRSIPSLQIDQEGYSRPVDGELPSTAEHDIGAIEVRPCTAPVELVLLNQTLTVGVVQACRRLIADPNVRIDGTVVLTARESVLLGEGFAVTPASDFGVTISRSAGGP